MQSSDTPRVSLQIRVGLFVLLGSAILLVAVAALSDVTWQPSVSFQVHLESAGGLQSGAPVRLGGVNVGRVVDLALREDAAAQHDGKPVRVRLKIEERARAWVRPTSCFAMNTQGFIGEPYLELVPGPAGAPAEADSVLCGQSMPPFYTVFGNLATLADRLVAVLDHPDVSVEAVAQAVGDAQALIATLRAELVDSGAIASMGADARGLLDSLHAQLPSLLEAGSSIAGRADRTLATAEDWLADPRLRAMWQRAERSTAKLETLAGNADKLIGEMAAGRGAVGAFMKDPQVYDDLKELVRDIRKNPWKLVWKD